jgi:hypothetical protein
MTQISITKHCHTYGDRQKPTSDIFVNGGKLGVTRNLEKVLRQLRTNKFYCSDRQCDCFQKPDSPLPLNYHFTFPSFLWIDAICIDQDNKEERAQQVTLMREIYRRASQVLVWLGPATEQTVPAFRLLFGLAELNEWPVDAAQERISHIVRDEPFKYHWVALGELLQREWWNRVWIIQEIFFAKKALVMCGPYATDWDRIEKAKTGLDYCLICIHDILEATATSGQPTQYGSFMEGMKKIMMINLLSSFMMQKKEISGPQDPDDDPFPALLDLTKNYSATDPRDKVYAILGLLEELGVPPPLSPDYNISICQLYIQVSIIIHEKHQRLQFLNYVERNALTSRNKKLRLPSWAPDWTALTNLGPLLGSGRYPDATKASGEARKPGALNKRFTFTGDSTANCIFDPNEKQIAVRGFIVDSVVEIGQRLVDIEPGLKFDQAHRYGKG